MSAKQRTLDALWRCTYEGMHKCKEWEKVSSHQKHYSQCMAAVSTALPGRHMLRVVGKHKMDSVTFFPILYRNLFIYYNLFTLHHLVVPLLLSSSSHLPVLFSPVHSPEFPDPLVRCGWWSAHSPLVWGGGGDRLRHDLWCLWFHHCFWWAGLVGTQRKGTQVTLVRPDRLWSDSLGEDSITF